MTSTDDLSEFPAVKDLLQIWGNEGGDMMIDQNAGEDDLEPIDINTLNGSCSDMYSTAQSVDESLDDRSCGNLSQKRRRVSSNGSMCSSTYQASISTSASSVRVRSSEFIEDFDVVLGDPHTPTLGTSLYRQVRQQYAKKNITAKELEVIKSTLHDKLHERMTLDVPAPTFWYSVKNKAKVKEGSQHRYLKTHIKKGAFGTLDFYFWSILELASNFSNRFLLSSSGIATDKAIIADVRNAPKRSRTRKKTHFSLQGTLAQVVEQAKEKCEEWVGTSDE